MWIHDYRTIKELKEEFQKFYPLLKIEFYKRSHEEGMGSSSADQYSEDLLLKDIRLKHSKGRFKIHPQNTVVELESAFEDHFGLHVQVFRKSNKDWIQTTATDQRTLQEQNDMALNPLSQIKPY